MRKRALLLTIITALVVIAGAIAWFWWRSAPPKIVRLLPSADAFVYLDLKPLRIAGVQLPPVSLEPEYEQFVRETGFQFERDLDEAAFAVHYPRTLQASPVQPQETRYSEIFLAHFDTDKVSAYLRKLAAGVEHYRGLDVYAIALPGRTLRVAILSPEVVAASNTEEPYVIQGIIDRFKAATPVAGPGLVRNYYRELPVASLAWAMTQTTPTGPQGNSVFELPGGYQVFLPPGTTVLAAVRYVGQAQFWANAFTGSEEQARTINDQLSAFAALVRTVAGAQAGNEPEIKTFLDSIRVEQRGPRVEVTATIPKGLLKKLVAETPAVPAVSPPQVGKDKPQPEKKKPARRRRRRR